MTGTRTEHSYLNIDYLMKHISARLHTMVKLWEHPISDSDPVRTVCARLDLPDIYLPDPLLSALLRALDQRRSYLMLPLLFSAGQTLFYAFLPSAKKDFLIGPVRFPAPVRMNTVLEPAFSDDSVITAAPVCSFSDLADCVLLLYNLLHQTSLTQDDLVTANCMDEKMGDTIMQDYSALVFDRQETEMPHNPYDQELREFSSIEQGNVEMLRRSLEEDYLGEVGTLAKDAVRHMRNRAIVVITLASRAAIRGGLLPEVSFSMCDVFIQKIEELSDPAVILNTMHQFEYQYAQMVAELKAPKSGRPTRNQYPRVDRCKDYIFQHLHEKIRIRDIADELFLNANYLSEIFKRSEGVTITEFILAEKVKLTKNLLSYSPYSYIEIASYLGFSSQSHLGKVFKKHTGLTLKQYRNLYGMKGF